MSASTVIRDVSETLEALLEDHVTVSSSLEVSLVSPQRVTLSTDHLLNLYLYQVVEHPFAKNRPPLARGAGELVRAPLALSLFYMLTPYVQDSMVNTDEHLILGDAMRVFYDHAIVTDPHLRGGLRGSGEVIVITLCRLNLEEQTRIWNALQMSYRLSVSYEVRIAKVDSERVWQAPRVIVQETRYDQL